MLSTLQFYLFQRHYYINVYYIIVCISCVCAKRAENERKKNEVRTIINRCTFAANGKLVANCNRFHKNDQVDCRHRCSVTVLFLFLLLLLVVYSLIFVIFIDISLSVLDISTCIDVFTSCAIISKLNKLLQKNQISEYMLMSVTPFIANGDKKKKK